MSPEVKHRKSRAVRITGDGIAPELQDIDVGVPREGEVQVRLRACGLNFADLLMIEGSYQDRPALPFTLGMEAAGVVEALGPGAEGPPPGTRVAVFGGQGGLAEFGNFPAAAVRPIPDTMSFAQAAGFQIAYGTSHLALTRRARLSAGERLVVLGAAGGVGLTAVEIGAALGAEVIAVARGEAKCAIARQAGAAHVLDASADLTAEIRALGGADVVYDPVGGEAFRALLRAMRPEGRMLTIGFASGEVPKIPANHLLVKNVDVIGLYWGGYLKFAPEVLGESLSELMTLFDAGKLRPHISHTLPLARFEEGLALLRERKATGKVVIELA